MANTTSQEKGVTRYEVNGEVVKLSHDIVCNYLTRGNAVVSRQEVVNFISICKYNNLNPFLSEAYLVKFQGSPAQMIVSKEAMFKRAEQCPEYDGIQAGIIVQRGDNVVEVEGCFKLATDILLGGWAKVYRKDRRFPIVARVNLSEYDKGQSVWKDKKNTMIAKVAKVAALREAFPQKLGAMYTSEELPTPVDDAPAKSNNTAAMTAEYARRAAEMSRRAAAPEPEDAELISIDESTGEVQQPQAPTQPTPTQPAEAQPVQPAVSTVSGGSAAGPAESNTVPAASPAGENTGEEKPARAMRVDSPRTRAAHQQAAESAKNLGSDLFGI